jgi:2-polyprenyl-3-methyl-5-hydroxy-6-metoxy-1,4-benzoquinol methylase
MNAADVVLLLVSQDFIASDYCYGIEMAQALKAHKRGEKRVVPIILKESTWQDTPLKNLQALPQDGKPLKEWKDSEKAYMNVYKGLQKVFSEFIAQKKNTQFDNQWEYQKPQAPKRSTFSGKKKSRPRPIGDFKENIYDSTFSEWYDRWYEGHWQSEHPFKTLLSLISSTFESRRTSLNKLKILDVACGTGNTFVAFTREGMNIYGTDGSAQMLQKARANCENINVSSEKLVLDPICWTDKKQFLNRFGKGEFDVILNTANSFCHLPPVDAYMQTALATFHDLLKPGGMLIIDTKKYVMSHIEQGVQFYKELRFGAEREWIERTDREETIPLPDLGTVRFHTRMHYDLDPSFGANVQRALIVVSVYGSEVTPFTFVIPYYPLPIKILKHRMERAGFVTNALSGFDGPLIHWKYDVAIGIKPLK